MHYTYIYLKAGFQWEMAIHKYTGRVPLGHGHIIIITIIIIYIYIIIQESINIYLNPALVTQAAARVRPED